MLKLAKERGKVRVVDSELVTPTSTRKLRDKLLTLSRSDRLWPIPCHRRRSLLLARVCPRRYLRLTDTQVSLKVAGPNEFPAKVPRPKYSVLENRALKTLRLSVFKSWQDGLHEYLEKRAGGSSANRVP